jgi:hypothetical protein
MNQEKVPNQAKKTHSEDDVSPLSPEVRDMIKHPPKIDR